MKTSTAHLRAPARCLIPLLLFAACLPADAAPLAGTRPDIIIVITDDQGMGDLSCMGNEVVQTPHIDRFYESSTRFTDFHVSPTCAPTRAALMSGRAPFKVGVTHTIMQRERMALDVFTLPEMLRSAGYTTGLFGKWHLGDEESYLPQNRGFDEVLMHGSGGIGQVSLGDFPPNGDTPYFDNVLLHNDTVVQTEGYCTDLFFDAASAWIYQQNQTPHPYFAYLSLNAPHAPLIAPESYTKRFLDLGYDKGTAGRYGMIENIDDNFGRLLTRLEKWQALENTLVIFMTDNGATHLGGTHNGKRVRHFNAGLKGGKNSPNEGGSHVPAFWQWKGVLPESVDIDALTAHLDFYPTFAELASANLPDTMQQLDGYSLLPLLEDAASDWPDRKLYFHCGRWASGRHEADKYKKCAVRTAQWRFVNNAELYDISRDPSETTDVAAAHPGIVGELRNSYDKWWQSAIPLMVNEGLPRVRPEEQPLALRYEKQRRESGIPDWAPPSIPQ